MGDVLSEVASAVIRGNQVEVAELTRRALEEGFGAGQVLNAGLMPGMDHVGEQFRVGEMFVPEVLRSARAMQASMNILEPLLAETGAQRAGKVLLGTVKGDVHDIGKNLVSMMLAGGGFEIVDLGTDVAPETFVKAVHRERPDIVGLSALLTTTMQAMAATIRALEEAGVRDRVKVLVGGAPITAEFAAQIGADAYGASAPAAVELARGFVGGAS